MRVREHLHRFHRSRAPSPSLPIAATPRVPLTPLPCTAPLLPARAKPLPLPREHFPRDGARAVKSRRSRAMAGRSRLRPCVDRASPIEVPLKVHPQIP
ncbi:hypothetical protein E2562_003984 [Oryza meyeriana var. granulata]|uniref:Uncharacterized protein n=1 Tax=Oryza meyeriana var. granulata TaxID=110450 RepID=A0A6G1BIZ5_9ORYZ|nr:hypothetical protein E2562_003984 [Oryza meyeriana var. granulata]